MDPARIIAETFVSEVECHRTLSSTNDRALERVEHGRPDGPLLILAEQQTKGRGRGTNRWWSSAGSLTFSVLLPLESSRLPTSRRPEMSLTVGSSICGAVSQLVPDEDIRLKWPNDVFLRRAKLAGVLVEVPPRVTEFVVVGIGLNVNNSVRSAPIDLQDRAIALCDIGVELSREDVLVAVLRELCWQLDSLADDPEIVRTLWRRFDLLFGQQVRIHDGRSSVWGSCAGIEDDGALLLRTETGVRRCYSGVVESFA